MTSFSTKKWANDAFALHERIIQYHDAYLSLGADKIPPYRITPYEWAIFKSYIGHWIDPENHKSFQKIPPDGFTYNGVIFELVGCDECQK